MFVTPFSDGLVVAGFLIRHFFKVGYFILYGRLFIRPRLNLF
ncbi:hypothetical protein l11_11820 [Neisseria weaveri LMG 5135]|nr:hypothetical protein l11_11820 [Neisseria weaveri LMG 5135]